jgi:hypothetical protein
MTHGRGPGARRSSGRGPPSEPVGFSDPFDSLAGGRWSLGGHQLLNSWFPAWQAGTPSPGAATLVDRAEATP